MKKVVVIGCGGHAKVVIDIIQQRITKLNEEILIVGILDDSFIENEQKKLFQIPLIGKINKILELQKDIYYVIAIGNNKIRKKIAQEYKHINYLTLIHPDSVIGNNVEIGCGTVVMAGAIINSYTTIGKHCILNSGSTVEHDNILGDYVHISPRAILCGGVKIGEESWIGAGAIVVVGVELSKNIIIGAGAVILKSIEKSNLTFIGIPGKILK
ncbi:acetyltransferase [Cetobacterium sp.]|uniref:acetyltransferase n=1 Tax=Cetobacterium sp. TaxID=2071632 RepID=UPI003F393295